MISKYCELGIKRLLMCKKILILGLVLLGICLIIAHQNEKVTRKYFMPLIKFKDLVVEDNMSGRELEVKFKTKIWLNNVVSSEKLEKYATQYEGFELNVLYDAKIKQFVIENNDAENVVTLDDMFAVIPDIGKKFFWIDLKNLDFNNKDASLKEMIAVVGRNILHKSNIIVESDNPEYLDAFAENGFLTSFYFPSLYRVKKQDIRQMLEVATDKYKKSTVDFISGDVRYFNFMDYYFPDAPKMYWNLGRDYKLINNFVLKHSDTKVILNQDNKYLVK